MGKMFSFLFEWLKKNRRRKPSRKTTGWALLFQVESGKVDLCEWAKLSVDESLVAPDPHMFGYRTFVVIKALGHGEKRLASRKLL